MVIHGEWSGQRLTISDKPGCLTVSLEKPLETSVYSFDYAGRLWTAFDRGISYRRGLDGKVVAKWELRDGSRDRRWLAPAEADALEEQARCLAVELSRALRHEEASTIQPAPDRVLSGLGRAALYDRARAKEDITRYHQVYLPVGILPPDQYMALVLQLTEGCSFNTCTFCNFYHGTPFRIKTPSAFRAHVQQVKDFLGEAISLRRTIFLGDANALVTPMKKLIPLLEVVREQFDIEALGGMFAFLDGFSGDKKSKVDYQSLANAGMKRIYIGLESGNADLLHFLKKPGQPEDAVQAVRAMKSAGIPVGIIILLGAGGLSYETAHVRDTITAVNRMELDADDLIYFSELIESEDLEYTRNAYDAALVPLTQQERISQGEEIQSGLKFYPSRGIPHISRYDIREFVY